MSVSPFSEFVAEDLTLPPQRESYIAWSTGQSDTGWTHLMKLCAASLYHPHAIELIKDLIAKTPKDKLKETLDATTVRYKHCALFYAFWRPPVVEILIRAGVSCGIVVMLGAIDDRPSGWHYLSDIIPFMPIDSVNQVLSTDFYINVHITNPLNICLQKNLYQHMMALLNAGFNPNIVVGRTLLYSGHPILCECVKRGDQRAFIILLSFGADVTTGVLTWILEMYIGKSLSKADAVYYIRALHDHGASLHALYSQICYDRQTVDNATKELYAGIRSRNPRHIKPRSEHLYGCIRIKLKVD